MNDIDPDALIKRHGTDALRVVNVMIEHAIRDARHDDALKLDRVRRIVVSKLNP